MLEKMFTKEQLNILAKGRAGADLAADIAHAHVTLYVPDEDEKYLYVYAQARPLTNFVRHSPSTLGRSLRRVEEPLVDRAMETGTVLTGLREWALGVFAKTKLFPLLDSKRKVFGVLAFEVSAEQEETSTNEIFIDSAREFLLNADLAKMQGNVNYRRLTPSDGVMVVDSALRILAANNTARHIFSVLGVHDLPGKRINSVQINWPLVGMALKTGIAESKELAEQGLKIAMRVIPLQLRPDGDRAVVVVTDVTELRKKDEALQIQAVVIKEIHHRVKNNLQTIASLLRLQSRRTKSEEARTILKDAINRVNSIALVHASLSQQEKGEIDLAQVTGEIYKAVLSSMVSPDLVLHTTFDVDKVFLPSEQATAVALILNELLQNALEHAFIHRTEGNLKVSFKVAQDKGILEIEDDGVGLPADFSLGHTNSLGLKIVQTMAESELGGVFTLIPKAQGTTARVTVPMQKK